MPFRSEKQRRYMFANHPEIAERWAEEEEVAKKKKMTAAEAAAERKRVDAFMANKGHGRRPPKPKRKLTSEEIEKKKQREAQAKRSKRAGFGGLLKALGLKD